MAASRSAGRTISTTVLTRWKTLTLAPAEFIRRFLIHVLPKGFHRIRRYGLLANGNRVKAIAKVRELLAMEPGKEKSEKRTGDEDGPPKGRTCPCCASPMRIIEVIDRGCTPRHQPAPGPIRIDTSWADDHARQASSDRRRRQPPPGNERARRISWRRPTPTRHACPKTLDPTHVAGSGPASNTQPSALWYL